MMGSHMSIIVGCIAAATLACGGSSETTSVTPPSGDFPSPLTVASGLQIKYFAKVPGARVMAMGADGAVYVVFRDRETDRWFIDAIVD